LEYLNMSLSIKQQVNAQTTQLLEQFKNAQERINGMTPLEQIHATNALQHDIALLTELQRKVEGIFRGSHTIPDIAEGELTQLSKKLHACAEILDNLDANNLTAISCLELADEVEKLFGAAVTPSQLSALQNRVTALGSANPTLNRGNRDAIGGLLSALQATQHPAAAPQTVPRQAQPSVSLPVTGGSELDGERMLRQTQDEEFQATLFTDKKNEIVLSEQDPVSAFEKMLGYYIPLKQYSASKTSFVSETASLTIARLLYESEDILTQICTVQASKESELTQAAQAQGGQSAAVENLRAKIVQAIDVPTVGNIVPYIAQIEEAYAKLSSDERVQLFNSLSEVLKQAGKSKGLPNGLRGQAFRIWPGSLDEKKKAVEKMLVPSTTTSAPGAVVKKANEMKRRLNEAMNLRPAPASMPRSSVQTTDPHSSDREIDMSAIAALTGLHFEDANRGQDDIQPNIAVLHSLLEILTHLRPSADHLELQEACQLLFMLDSKGIKEVFKMSDPSPRPIADRPYYHMYHIHRNETPESLREDTQYGNHAFSGVHPASNSERLRSIQRTIVELSLQNLEDAINFDDGATAVQLLQILEGVKVDAKDRAEGQENVAYNLFGAFYHLHVDARRHNPALIDPNDAQFKGDFGREGFRKSMPGIEPGIKLAAITQVHNALKAVWKVQ
jgi:hypothetical protein